uniref:Zinc finger protein 596 n=1 Tax=Panthera leo TaxID=9689 RepID=A0A8C8XCY2_PANLE
MQAPESVTFEDIAVDFTKEEWALLSASQRKLFRDVMLESINHLIFLENNSSQRSFRLEQEGELQSEGTGFLQEHSPDMESLHKKQKMILTRHIHKKGMALTVPKHKSLAPENPIECTDLGDAFTQRSALTQHLLIHLRRKHYISKQCRKSLSEQSSLTRHNQIHTQGKLYKCHVCGKAFSNCFCLRRHEMIHTGERPYECHVCGKAFRQNSYLRQHENIHTRKKSYECHLCKKAFSHRSYLRKHERIHSGEKCFQCHECKKTFSQSSGLSQHKRIHTGDKPHVCLLCGKAFIQGSELRR